MVRKFGIVSVALDPTENRPGRVAARNATVGDVRAWLAQVDSLGFRDSDELEECCLYVEMQSSFVMGWRESNSEWMSDKTDVLLIRGVEGEA